MLSDFYYPQRRTRMSILFMKEIIYMENQQLMSLIAERISDELDWREYVGEREKLEMVKEVLNIFSKIMEAIIVNTVSDK